MGPADRFPDLAPVERGKSPLPSGPLTPEVMGAIRYIRRNYGSIVQVEDIPEALGCPYNTLRRNFRRETRLTLAGFLALVRVRAAIRFMEQTDRLIKEIAWEVGLEYEERLTRAFVRLTGHTPQYVRARSRLRRLIQDSLDRSGRFCGSKMRVKNSD